MTILKGQWHESHFKNLWVQKHIYSNRNLQEVVHFHQKKWYHYANNRNSSPEPEKLRWNFSSFAMLQKSSLKWITVPLFFNILLDIVILMFEMHFLYEQYHLAVVLVPLF